ncbi:MAG TPA: Spy/CpxP family protein refolding chaperone [Candidatus Competibacteraceae bacterium]|nr:Spy/CpxP family protein refolding chaperone [Candidatus Competibacteraceae bacterium]
MSKLSRTLLASALAVILGVAALPLAAAQTAPATGQGTATTEPVPGDAATMRERMQKRYERHQARLEERLEALHKDLKLTPEQEEPWKAFSEALRQQMAARPMMMPEEMQGKNVVERYQAHVQAMEQRLEGMRGVNRALEALYAKLTPEQRQVLDDAPLYGPRMGKRR